MLGVMLQRPPSPFELANDLDERLVTWWRAVRDRTEEFAHLVETTPASLAEWREACKRLDDPDLLRRALAVHIVLTQGFIPGLGHKVRGWRRWRKVAHCDVRRLAQRLADVVLDCRDAVDVLVDHAGKSSNVIYCDPPYLLADRRAYRVDVDRGRLAEVLRGARAQVAISGYGAEWDSLGWARHELETFTTTGAVRSSGRVEVLWTNFQPEGLALA